MAGRAVFQIDESRIDIPIDGDVSDFLRRGCSHLNAHAVLEHEPTTSLRRFERHV